MINNPERNPKIAYYQCPGCWHAETEAAVKNMVVDMTCPVCRVHKISQFVPVPKITSQSVACTDPKELIEALAGELKNQWEMNHGERCDNTHGCASFGNPNNKCSYPRPKILSQVKLSIEIMNATATPFLRSVAADAVELIRPDKTSIIYKFDADQWREATEAEAKEIRESLAAAFFSGGVQRMPHYPLDEADAYEPQQKQAGIIRHYISAVESAFRVRLPWGKGSGKISE
jgi:hypothetical protein